jgi:DnaJ-class molecular chaperone
METKIDYYGILGVPRTASSQEIESAFKAFTAAFHASGKPKTIDDVEQLRQAVRACGVLRDSERRSRYDQGRDDSPINQPVPAGYDFERLESISRSVDNEIILKRNIWIADTIGSELFDLVKYLF